MKKVDRRGNAAKVVALCLPPVLMAIAGLVGISRRKDATVAARSTHAPTVRSTKPAARG